MLLLLILGIIFLFFVWPLGVILLLLWLILAFWNVFASIILFGFQSLWIVLVGLYHAIRLIFRKKEDTNLNPTEKKCEYCKTIIDKKATICPICKKEQNFGIKSILAAITTVILLFLMFYCIKSLIDMFSKM